MRFGAMLAGGVLGLVGVKLLAVVMAPMVGVVVGMLLMGFKALFWLSIAYVVYRIFFRRRRHSAED